MNVTLGIYVVAACITDLRKSVIPNYLTVGACLVGLFLHGLMNGGEGLLSSLIGLLIGFCLMLPLYIVGAVGAGDVKLFAGIGALTGFTFVLSGVIYSLLCAGVIGLIILIWRKEFFQRMIHLLKRIWLLIWLRDFSVIRTIRNEKNVTFPFMIAVVPGIIITYCDYWL